MDGPAAGVLPGRPRWRIVGSGLAAVAERDALGTTARLAVWPASSLRAAVGAVDRELERLDLAASRFRSDSEIFRVYAQQGEPADVSAGLAEAIGVALAAAQWSGGLVDPTIGAALIALGYDRDFVEVQSWDEQDAPSPAVPPSSWLSVRLDGQRVQVPAGVLLDLGATAKGLGADWSARAAFAASECGGVVVSLGGDVAAAGDTPQGGWPVLVADDHRQSARSASGASATQVVRLTGGGLATSSIACRQWRRSGRTLHHIVDPRTGQPARGPWRTVSVAAATCADANAASTAAIVCGSTAPEWLDAQGIPARLVRHDGSVIQTGAWPPSDGGQLTPPEHRWLRLPDVAATEQGARR
jgi:FAD:protein FMN transferase